jgi:hypothetical protein
MLYFPFVFSSLSLGGCFASFADEPDCLLYDATDSWCQGVACVRMFCWYDTPESLARRADFRYAVMYDNGCMYIILIMLSASQRSRYNDIAHMIHQAGGI